MALPPLRPQLLKLLDVCHPHWPIRSSAARHVRRRAPASQQVRIAVLRDSLAECGRVYHG